MNSKYWKYKSINTINTNLNNIINYHDPEKNVTQLYDDKYNIQYINENNIIDLKNHLDKYYNYIFSLEQLKWLVFNPFTNYKYNILLYDNEILIGSIIGIKKKIKLKNKTYDCIHVTLLCISKQYRNKYLHCYMIDQLMNNIRQDNILLALFNTTKPIKNLIYFKIYNTYIIKNISYVSITYTNFDFNMLNDRQEDLYFIYTKDEYDYWFDNNFIIKIINKNNFMAFMKIGCKTQNGIININLLIESYKCTNIHNVPNNSIIYNNYNSINTYELESKLYLYIYNYYFDNINTNICLF
ncbi:putative N-myristoyl transferase [Alphaentomopoxvirus acuprea]|uniref:glycylpeptide N-tetradecanoyltransferase n=1 Tax=Alphaentomopoxvirus acuprea TaxID=62099 RepID=W6JLN7_9POXV|nr:putative N-myristoyl transferase [Anomala cuprea entomopoxvirus]BAO49566.1 putative N-myristoyl transferase [Anomala cuprea entomopoxvirus]